MSCPSTPARSAATAWPARRSRPSPCREGSPAPGLVSFVLVSKFADHLPLYRLEDILFRHGVSLSRSTLCDWVRNAAVLLGPLADLQRTLVLQSDVIWTDDTHVTVLGGETARQHQGSVLGLHRRRRGTRTASTTSP